MSTLLLDNDSEDAHILKKTKILNKHVQNEPALEEIEKTIQESASDLPLGKALNLLVHVHSHIFDKAVQAIRDSSPAELTIKAIEMPTVRAIVSIENYLSASDHVRRSFKHVYDSLHEKFIKRSSKSNSSSEPAMRIIGYFILHSKYQKDIQQCICDELKSDDKRSQLAAVLLLQFLFTHYISLNDQYCELSTLFIPPLVYISNKYRESPTLLACSSCDLALQFTGYIALHMNDRVVKPISNGKIMVLSDDESNNTEHTYQSFIEALDQIKTLFHIMEEWQKSAGQLEAESYKALHQCILYTQKNIHIASLQKQLVDVWDLILTYLTPKLILSAKPLVTKKQKLLLSFKLDDDDKHIPSLMPTVKIMLITILQKNRLVELCGPNPITVIHTPEEEEIKRMFVAQYDQMIKSLSTYKDISKLLIIQLITKLPNLCKTVDINSEELIQTIIDTIEYDKESRGWMVDLCKKQPDSSICNLLLHVMHQDNMSKSCYELLGDLIEEDSKEIIQIIEKNLLSVIKSSNQACELLIQCMSYTDLTSLIQKLMAMTDVDNEREKMTCIALIAKALLHESWADSSILLYVDMIRDVKAQKGFTRPVQYEDEAVNTLTPASIVDYKKEQNKVIKEYNEQELNDICTQLMAPFQLWSTKVDGEKLKCGLKQLVHKSYGLPNDATCIDVWRYLSFTFSNDHSLIWVVISECLNVMTSQPINMKDDHVISQDEVFLILSPLLILHTIPKEAFDLIQLPSSYVNLVSNKFSKIGIDPKTIKQSNTAHSKLGIQLVEELLKRSTLVNHGQLEDSLDSLTSFSKSLIVNMYCT